MNYYLSCNFGGQKLTLDVPNLKELTITQDINKFLPEFRMRVVDSTGELTHMMPIDNFTGRMTFGFSQTGMDEKQNFMEFDTYVFLPEGTQSAPTATYDVEGLLHVSDLMTSDFSRSFSGPVNTTIQTLAEEIGIEQYFLDISPSLNYERNIIQPYWNNMQLLKYLKERLAGSGGEWGFKCFLYCSQGRTRFSFKGLSEMIANPPAFKFVLSDIGYEDHYPIYNYAIYGNSKIYTAFAGATQSYTYFDYETEEFVVAGTSARTYKAMTDYILIDAASTTGSNYLVKLGRSNDFDEMSSGSGSNESSMFFQGYVKNNFGNRLMDLVKLWITTQGISNISPGQVVQIFFPFGQDGGDMASYQYSGNWLVERVVHNFGTHFLTKLLLTRSGIDTDLGSSLLKAGV